MKQIPIALSWKTLRLFSLPWAVGVGATMLTVAALTVAALAQTSLPLHPEETPGTVSSSSDPVPAPAVEEPTRPEVEVSPAASEDLVGLTIGQVRTSLANQGWYFVVRTPRLAQLENGAQGLDLWLDPNNSEIIEASLVDLN